MLDGLKAFFGELWTTVSTWFLNTWMGKFFGALFAVSGFLWTLMGPLWDLLNFDQAMQSIADTFNEAAGIMDGLPVSTALAQVNHLFPLNELIVLTGLHWGLLVLVMSIRFAVWLFNICVQIVTVLINLFKALS